MSGGKVVAWRNRLYDKWHYSEIDPREVHDNGKQTDALVLQSDLDAAIAQAKAAERDAARYIYLKKMWTVSLLNGKVAMRNAYGITADSAKGIDAVIDAAIANLLGENQ